MLIPTLIILCTQARQDCRRIHQNEEAKLLVCEISKADIDDNPSASHGFFFAIYFSPCNNQTIDYNNFVHTERFYQLLNISRKILFVNCFPNT